MCEQVCDDVLSVERWREVVEVCREWLATTSTAGQDTEGEESGVSTLPSLSDYRATMLF